MFRVVAAGAEGCARRHVARFLNEQNGKEGVWGIGNTIASERISVLFALLGESRASKLLCCYDLEIETMSVAAAPRISDTLNSFNLRGDIKKGRVLMGAAFLFA